MICTIECFMIFLTSSRKSLALLVLVLAVAFTVVGIGAWSGKDAGPFWFNAFDHLYQMLPEIPLSSSSVAFYGVARASVRSPFRVSTCHSTANAYFID